LMNAFALVCPLEDHQISPLTSESKHLLNHPYRS
jgi:hypothetical protein